MITNDVRLIGPWVAEKTGGTWCYGRGSGLGKIKDGRLVAGVLYEDYNGANVVCHIRGEPGWADRRFLGIIFDYPFNQLNVKRITVPVNSTNKESIKLVRHMGFTLEATLKDACVNADLSIYAMFKNECKYLDERYKCLITK